MSLIDIKRDLVELLEEHLSIIAGGYPAMDLGESFEEAASCLQAIGCCNLLLAMDVEGFQRNMIWAGFARRCFLRRCAAERYADFHMARSRCESFFCTMAGGDFALAKEIGALSPMAWVPDGEYEEDFAYYRFIHLVLDGANEEVRTPMLQLEAALQGVPSSRLDICYAIHAADSAMFESAFGDLVEARTEHVESERMLFDDDITFVPRSNVFVEGLALLRLAEHLGLGPRRREYAQCPHIARAILLHARPDDIFDEIEQAVKS